MSSSLKLKLLFLMTGSQHHGARVTDDSKRGVVVCFPLVLIFSLQLDPEGTNEYRRKLNGISMMIGKKEIKFLLLHLHF